MNIFKDLEFLIFKQEDHLCLSHEYKEKISRFLNAPSTKTAKELFKHIQEFHTKESVFTLMNDLHLYEESLGKIIPNLRDHYIHSACVFVVGLAMYNSSETLRNSLVSSRYDPTWKEMQTKSFLFRWAIASCLHDLAYPLELSLKTFNNYIEKLNGTEINCIKINWELVQTFNTLAITNKPYWGYESNDTALELIAHWITKEKSRGSVTYQDLHSCLVKYINNGLEKGRIDHGIMSAFITLKKIHSLYEKKEWNILDFNHEVVDSCTAIFLHNAYKYSDLKDIYGGGKYLYDFPSPLGYLLFVSDTMCEWRRSKNNNKDACLFELKLIDGKVNFFVNQKFQKKIEGSTLLFDDRCGPIVQFN